MVIDSSVLIAILCEELDASGYVKQILQTGTKRIRAASLLETRIVMNREKGAAGLESLMRFIEKAAIEVIAFDKNQAEIAFSAHQRFGKGMGHPAQLNILDCCCYAPAATSGEPLLFKGNDFGSTDIQIATE